MILLFGIITLLILLALFLVSSSSNNSLLADPDTRFVFQILCAFVIIATVFGTCTT